MGAADEDLRVLAVDEVLAEGLRLRAVAGAAAAVRGGVDVVAEVRVAAAAGAGGAGAGVVEAAVLLVLAEAGDALQQGRDDFHGGLQPPAANLDRHQRGTIGLPRLLQERLTPFRVSGGEWRLALRQGRAGGLPGLLPERLAPAVASGGGQGLASGLPRLLQERQIPSRVFCGA